MTKRKANLPCSVPTCSISTLKCILHCSTSFLLITTEHPPTITASAEPHKPLTEQHRSKEGIGIVASSLSDGLTFFHQFGVSVLLGYEIELEGKALIPEERHPIIRPLVGLTDTVVKKASKQAHLMNKQSTSDE